jgi:hypothetical protein
MENEWMHQGTKLKDKSRRYTHQMSTLRLFLDCEFSSLEKPRLLSLGLSDGGQLEFYIELDVQGDVVRKLKREMSAFVLDTVVPQMGLTGTVVPDEKSAGTTLAAWLERQPGALEVAYDYHVDFDLLESALKTVGAWNALQDRLVPTHVAYLWGDESALTQAEASWAESFASQGIDRHHALADARALARAFRAVHGR